MTTTPSRTPATRKAAAPADHKPAAADRRFSFTHGGKEYTFPNPVSVITSPGFIRKNRRREELDFGFTALEALAGDTKAGVACLDAIDEMEPEEFNTVMEALWEFADMPAGE